MKVLITGAKGQLGNELASILKNEADEAKSDVVKLNTALALLAFGRARDIQDGLEMADYALKSSKAYETLKKVISVSNKV